MTNELFKLKEELLIYARNQDIFSTTNRGVTTRTDTGTFTGATTHTLTTSPTRVKNVRSVVVAGNTLTRHTDYTVNYKTGVITFTVAQTGVYTITYDEASTDRIFSDFPQENLKLNQFPRIAIDVISGSVSDVGVGTQATYASYTIIFRIYEMRSDVLDEYCNDVFNKINANKKNFYYLDYIRPDRISSVTSSPAHGDKILARSVEFIGWRVI